MKSYFDIQGDGGSGVVDQVVAQRDRVAERLRGVRHLLAIGSGKGGVGKSTLTALLARTLRAEGLRVAILDADLNGPCQARLAGVDAPLVPGDDGVLTMPRASDGTGIVSLGAIVPEDQVVDFGPAGGGDSHVSRATCEFTFLSQLLGSVQWGELDVLLVDLPPGAERTVQYAEFFGERTAFVLVTIPSSLARGVVSRSAVALARTPNRLLGYVENMSGYYCAECAAVKPLFPESDAADLGVPALGRVPFDPRLAAACDRGVTLDNTEDIPAIEVIRAIASRIARDLETES